MGLTAVAEELSPVGFCEQNDMLCPGEEEGKMSQKHQGLEGHCP